MRDGNSFLLEYSSNDSDDWILVRKLKKDIDFMNNKFYETSIEFYPSQLSSTSKIRLRFRCKGSNIDSQVYVDEVDFSGIQNPISTNQSSNTERFLAPFPFLISSFDALMSEDSSVLRSESTPLTWTLITFDSFENGWGNYRSGGSNAVIIDMFSSDGMFSARISNDRENDSFFYHYGFYNVSQFSNLRMKFWFYSSNLIDGDLFVLQYSSGYSLKPIKKFEFRHDFLNDEHYEVSVMFNINDIDFSSIASLRFKSIISPDHGGCVYIDEIDFSGQVI